jgi:hypothetical protein
LYTCQRFLYHNNKICTLCMMPLHWMVILLYSFHLDIPVHYCRSQVIISSKALYHNYVITFSFHECLKLSCNSSPFRYGCHFTAIFHQCPIGCVIKMEVQGSRQFVLVKNWTIEKTLHAHRTGMHAELSPPDLIMEAASLF